MRVCLTHVCASLRVLAVLLLRTAWAQAPAPCTATRCKRCSASASPSKSCTGAGREQVKLCAQGVWASQSKSSTGVLGAGCVRGAPAARGGELCEGAVLCTQLWAPARQCQDAASVRRHARLPRGAEPASSWWTACGGVSRGMALPRVCGAASSHHPLVVGSPSCWRQPGLRLSAR